MDNVNKQVVEFFKSIGFTLIEIKSSVFRIEESTWVFQTDHKDHSVDASTILYKDAEKIFTQALQAQRAELEGRKFDFDNSKDDDICKQSYYSYNQAIQDQIDSLDALIKELTK